MDLKFTRGSRNFALAMILIGIMALFAMRLFYIQVIRHDYYVSQADTQQIKPFTLFAKRGEIYTYDNGSPEKFVMNETVYTAWVDPTQATDRQAIVDALNKIAGGNTRKNFAQYIDKKNTRYQVLATKVSRKQAELLKAENIRGLGFDAVSQRVYPEGQLASQVLGFVDNEGNGKYGFEQANDDELKGKDGLLKTVTDVRAVPLTIGAKNINKPAQDGKNYVLSLDRYIQARVEKALADGVSRSAATSASAIVMDPQTGRVMAMANFPSYDPTLLATVTDPALFNNDVISRPYEPGSDIKTFTVATGIDKRVITPETTFNNTDSVRIEDIVITNASKGHTGPRTMQYALDWSLNTGMVEIAKRLGNGDGISRSARDTMYNYFHDRFRLGRVTDIELANEAEGTVVSPDKTEGNAVRYSNMAFGQGMDATMLQVVAGFSGVVNGGTYRTPTIIAGSIDENGVYRDAQPRESFPGIISAASSNTVREMVHQSHYATYKPQNEPAGYYVGGKTGTSQTIENGKYVSDQTIGTYLGFGGEVSKTPRYVVMVEISAKGKMMGGGADAKPIFNDISNWMIDYLKLQPQG
jgi:cell division protein FtsI (penicillin-binding protein 3)